MASRGAWRWSRGRNTELTAGAYAAVMDRQKEFVLRTLEERDIRFVRLWFTDVLGYLKSVAIAPGRTRRRLRRGHRLRRLVDRRLRAGVRIRHRRPARSVDLPGAAVDHERGQAPLGADVLRHHHARRVAVMGRLAARAAPSAGQGQRPGLLLLRAPRDRVLPAAARDRTTARFRSRPTTAATSTRPCTTPRRTSAGTPSTRWSRWASRWSSATTRARPASRRSTCATPTRCRWPTTS